MAGVRNSSLKNTSSRAATKFQLATLLFIGIAFQFSFPSGANAKPEVQSAERFHHARRSLLEGRSNEFALHTPNSGKSARSMLRRKHLGVPVSPFLMEGEYTMPFSIGTPAREFVGILDTGSDVVWVQCDPCVDCVPQAAIFEPTASDSFESISCHNQDCIYLNDTLRGATCSTTDACNYSLQYGTGGTLGELSSEVLTLTSDGGQKKTFPEFVFGCSHQVGAGAFPIVGLSRSNLSLVSQLGPKVGTAFSFCFGTYFNNRTTKFTLGSSGKENLAYTPLIGQSDDYNVNLTGISVDGTLLPISTDVINYQPDGTRGVTLDTGSTVSVLEPEAYNTLRSAVASKILYPKRDLNGTSLGDLTSSWGIEFDLCYNVTGLNVKSLDQLDLPTITFHFQELDLQLPESNTFFFAPQADNVISLICLAMVPDTVGIGSTFGNYQMQNHYFFLDPDNSRVGMKPENC